MIQPVVLNLKAVGGGQVDVIVLDRDDHVGAEGDILADNLKLIETSWNSDLTSMLEKRAPSRARVLKEMLTTAAFAFTKVIFALVSIWQLSTLRRYIWCLGWNKKPSWTE